MSKARELADVIGTQDTTENVLQGRRNLIINGAMQVAQRGTSWTGISNGDATYYLDRFQWGETGACSAVFTISQSTDAPSGFSNSFKMETTTATLDGNYKAFRYYIEAQDLRPLAYGTSDAKAATLSFYVKSNKTGTGTVFFYQYDSSEGFSKTYTINAADTWERKTIAIPANTSGAPANDNGLGWLIEWGVSVASGFKSLEQTTWGSYSDTMRHYGNTIDITTSTSDYFAITGVQLEVGSVATPFEHRSYGEELALCQRYYYRMEGGSHYGAVYGNTGNIFVIQSLPVVMRTDPTLSYTSIGGGGSANSDYTNKYRIQYYISDTDGAGSLYDIKADAEL